MLRRTASSRPDRCYEKSKEGETCQRAASLSSHDDETMRFDARRQRCWEGVRTLKPSLKRPCWGLGTLRDMTGWRGREGEGRER